MPKALKPFSHLAQHYRKQNVFISHSMAGKKTFLIGYSMAGKKTFHIGYSMVGKNTFYRP